MCVGLNANLYLMGQQRQTILQKAIVGPGALPYQPFKKYRGNDPDKEPSVMSQRADVVDYAVERMRAWNRLARRNGATSILTSQNDVHPVLISEREMARLGMRFNPSVALIYSTEGPLEERHDDPDILLGAGKNPQPSRQKYGSTGMSK